MLRGGTRTGFKEPEEVEAKLKTPAVLATIGGPGAKVKTFAQFKASAGGTQSQLGKLTLEDDRLFFVKQSRFMKDIEHQQSADDLIRTALGPYTENSPFNLMIYSGNLSGQNGLAVFPFITGFILDRAFEETRSRTFPPVRIPAKIPPDKKIQAYQKIGAALSQIHIDGMRNKNELEGFYAGGCDLNGKSILIHKDMQASNVMFSEEGKVYFVDTTGIVVGQREAYENIYDSLQGLAYNDSVAKKAILEGYLSNYEPSKQAQVLSSIITNIAKEPYNFTIPNEAIPTTPVTVGDLSQIHFKSEQQEPSSSLEGRPSVIITPKPMQENVKRNDIDKPSDREPKKFKKSKSDDSD